MSRSSVSTQAAVTVDFGVDSTTFTNLERNQKLSWISDIQIPLGYSYGHQSSRYTLDGVSIPNRTSDGRHNITLIFVVTTDEDFVENCSVEHSLTGSFSIVVEDLALNFVTENRSMTVPYTFADENLTPVTVDHTSYMQTEICATSAFGQINDIIEWVPQEGVALDRASWGNGELLIMVEPAEGYVFTSGYSSETIRVSDLQTLCESSTVLFDDQPSALEGVSPGQTVEISATLQPPAQNPFDTASIQLKVGGIDSATITPSLTRGSGEAVQLSFDYIVPQNFESICTTNGVVHIELFAQLAGPNGPYRGVFKEEVGLVRNFPCSKSTSVTPDVNLVTQTAVCGAANDEFSTSQQGVKVSSVTWSDNVATVTLAATDGYYIPTGVQTEFDFVDEAPCIVTPVPPELETTACGSDNDVVAVPEQPEGVTVTDTHWVDNQQTITLSPAEGYAFPTDTKTTFEFTDEGQCVVTPIAPELGTTACGSNNDMITAPEQPEGVTVTDTHWVENQRTITLTPADGYVFPVDTKTTYEFEDENITCEEEPIGVQLTVILKTSDGASIEGTAYQFYAPAASQAAQAPYVEGVVDANNQIVLTGLLPGEYRLVTAPEGYDPVNEVLSVTDDADEQEITIEVNAIQVPITPEPSPTVTPEPTTEPTVQPTSVPTEEATAAPTESSSDSGPVTGLPETGAGHSNNSLILGVGGLLSAAIVMMAIGKRKFR